MKKKWLAAPIGFVALICLLAWDAYGFWPIASMSGNIAARWDTWHGRYKVLGYGMPTPWRPDYENMLRDRYGIQFKAVTGCIVDQWILDRVDAYDRISEDRIRAKFGRDVVHETAEEASLHWEQIHARATH